MRGDLDILPLGGVALSAVAVVLADAFHEDGGNGVDEWHGLLEREVESSRLDLEHSCIARVGQNVVGACLVNLGPDARGRIGPTGVSSSVHRSGIGTRLVAEAKRALASAGMRRVTLEVGQENSAALALYESQGFTRDRPLMNLRVRRTRLDLPPQLPPVQSMSFQEALDRCASMPRSQPAFQRMSHYLRSFEQGSLAYAVGEVSQPDGVLICRGRAVLDIAVSSHGSDALLALLLRATQHAGEIRIIHEPSEGGIVDSLRALGAAVESEAWEMSWVP